MERIRLVEEEKKAKKQNKSNRKKATKKIIRPKAKTCDEAGPSDASSKDHPSTKQKLFPQQSSSLL